MQKKVIYSTQWVAKDATKEYSHGWGFMSPYVECPQDMDVAEACLRIKELLSNEEFECIGVIPVPLLIMSQGTPPSIINLNFGDAIAALKRGKKVARPGWNGKGMYLYFVPANSYPAQTDIAKAEFGDMVPYGAYIAIKTVQGTVEAGWKPSSMDMLAEDWEILD